MSWKFPLLQAIRPCCHGHQNICSQSTYQLQKPCLQLMENVEFLRFLVASPKAFWENLGPVPKTSLLWLVLLPTKS